MLVAMQKNEWWEPGHVAIVTGASKGFGRAVASLLAQRGISLVVDARGEDALDAAAAEFGEHTRVRAVPGDVADSDHVHRLVNVADEAFGRIDLVVNNASTIGRSPMPHLENLSPQTFDRLFTTNVYAPLHLIQHALPIMRRNGGGTIVNVSSDAGVVAYEGWGGYGSSKAALDQVSAVMAAEEPDIKVYALDPGDMRTAMHQRAYPGEDISDRPEPEVSAPAILRLVAERPRSGRYRAASVLDASLVAT